MKKKKPKPPTRRDKMEAIQASWHTALNGAGITHAWIIDRYKKEALYNGRSASHAARVAALDKLTKLRGEPPPPSENGMPDLAAMSTADLVAMRDRVEKLRVAAEDKG
jgi:hypothetical protein